MMTAILATARTRKSIHVSRTARRVVAPLLAALLLLASTATAGSVSAESAVQVRLVPSATELQAGQTLVLALHLLDAPDLQQLGPITIQLDAARFAAPEVAAGPTVPTGFATKIQDGRLLVSFLDDTSGTKPIPQDLDVLLCTISLQVLDDPTPGASALALVGASGFLDADGLEVSAYTADLAAVTVRLPPTATPEPSATPTPDPSVTPAGPTGALTTTPAATPTVTPATGDAPFDPEPPSWLWLAFLVTLAVALFELFLLLGRAGRRPAGRSSRRR